MCPSPPLLGHAAPHVQRGQGLDCATPLAIHAADYSGKNENLTVSTKNGACTLQSHNTSCTYTPCTYTSCTHTSTIRFDVHIHEIRILKCMTSVYAHSQCMIDVFTYVHIHSEYAHSRHTRSQAICTFVATRYAHSPGWPSIVALPSRSMPTCDKACSTRISMHIDAYRNALIAYMHIRCA